MSVRELVLAAALIAGLCLVVTGVYMLSIPAAYITGGVGVAGLGVLFLTEVGS